jgi:hypothetical protein
MIRLAQQFKSFEQWAFRVTGQLKADLRCYFLGHQKPVWCNDVGVYCRACGRWEDR